MIYMNVEFEFEPKNGTDIKLQSDFTNITVNRVFGTRS